MPGIKKGAKKLEGEKVNESNQILIAVTTLTANMDNIEKNFKVFNDKLDKISNMSEQVIEVKKNVERAHERIDDVKEDFKDKLKSQDDEFCEKIKVLDDRVKKVDDTLTWVWRTIGGAVILAIVGTVLVL